MPKPDIIISKFDATILTKQARKVRSVERTLLRRANSAALKNEGSTRLRTSYNAGVLLNPILDSVIKPRLGLNSALRRTAGYFPLSV